MGAGVVLVAFNEAVDLDCTPEPIRLGFLNK
ncbi:hypothetical protein GP5015_1650 [gamma proteobacterium HTCC5015]|nr:hypothetical protein GP5015_1650 [gamma proteobacterium HTCC5015]